MTHRFSPHPLKTGLTITSLLLAGLSQAQSLRFQFTSDPGDYIGQGQTRDVEYRFGASDTAFLNVSLAQSGSSGPDYITISAMKNPVSTAYLLAQVGTNRLNHPLRAGTYLNAMRAPFADPGRPGLDISFEHRGSNTLTGSFLIQQISYTQLGSNSWRLDRLQMSFVQNSEGGVPAMRGSILYVVPEPLTLTALGIPALVLMRRRKSRIV